METGDSNSSPATGSLRWWHWVIFLLPGIVSGATAWILVEMNLARDRASGYTFLSDYGRSHLMLGCGAGGLMAGGIACVVAGLVLGFTTRARYRVLAAIWWMVASAFAGLGISFVGCGAAEPRLEAYRREVH